MATSRLSLSDINIRTCLKPGDMGYITYLHGQLYHQEYGYTLAFEAYVAAGLAEFNRQYDSKRNRGLGGGAQRQNGGLTAAYGPQ